MNIGIIGLGRMGKNLLKSLHHIKEYINTTTEIDDIFIYDIKAKETEELSKLYHVKPCISLEHLNEAADALIIATPTSTHLEIASFFIQRNKDVFIEKPIASAIEEAQTILEEVSKKNIICMVGHVERFNPAVLYLNEYLKGKKIRSISADRISKAQNERYFDTDAVKDLMIHDIDIILSMVNCKIQKLSAAANSEDFNYVIAIIQFENNITANLTVNRLAFERSRKLCINTDEEAIHLNFIERKIDFYKPFIKDKLINQQNTNQISGMKETVYFDGDSLMNELLHFINCIKTRAKPICNEQTAALALDIANQIVINTKKMG